MLAAHRADNFRMGGNKFIHLVKGHAVHIHVLALLAVGNQLVRTVAALAGAAVHQRVAEVATWPVVTQVCGFIRIAASRPTL